MIHLCTQKHPKFDWEPNFIIVMLFYKVKLNHLFIILSV